MKFSKKTLDVLSNFSKIENSLMFNPEGKGILSAAEKESKGVCAFYDLPEDEKSIPTVPIYDVSNFLIVLNEVVGNADYKVEFQEKFMIVSTSTSRLKFHFASEEMIPKPLTRLTVDVAKEIKVRFQLTWANFQKLLKISTALGYTYFKIENKTNKILITVYDPKDPTTNTFQLFIGNNETEYEDFSIVVHRDELKMMDGDYQVEIWPGKMIVFRSMEDLKTETGIQKKETGLVYYVAPVKEKK